MALISINRHPGRKDLRDFGDIALAMMTVIALVLHWREKLTAERALVVCAAGLAIYVLSRISTKLVKPIYLGMVLLTFPIGWVISHTVMVVFYYLMLTPVGLVFRLIGRDSLHRKWDKKATTYWLKHRPADSTKRYFNQY